MEGTSWPLAVQEQLRHFAEDRDWGQFHTPQNLLLATMGELGELAELFQWNGSDPPLERVAEEVADVLLYLLRFADVVGVDVESAVKAKLASNAARYPVATWRGRAGRASDDKSRRSGSP